MSRTTFLLLFFFVVLVGLCDAKLTQTNVVTGSPELYLEYVKFDTLNLGLPVQINTHVYNASGVALTNSTVSCTIHTYNQSSHVEDSSMLFEGDDFYYDLNLSKYDYGEYYYVIYCVNGSLGGFVSDNFVFGQAGLTTDLQNLFPTVLVVTLFGIALLSFGAYLVLKPRRGGAKNDY